MMFFNVQMLLTLIKCHLSTSFLFWHLFSESYLRIHYKIQAHEHLALYFFSNKCRFFIYVYVFHSIFIFPYGVRRSVISLAHQRQLPQHHVLKMLYGSKSIKSSDSSVGLLLVLALFHCVSISFDYGSLE